MVHHLLLVMQDNLHLTNLIDRLGYNLYDVADANLVDPTTGKLNPAANSIGRRSLGRCSL